MKNRIIVFKITIIACSIALILGRAGSALTQHGQGMVFNQSGKVIPLSTNAGASRICMNPGPNFGLGSFPSFDYTFPNLTMTVNVKNIGTSAAGASAIGYWPEHRFLLISMRLPARAMSA